MFELIAFIIFIVSVLGIAIILFRKMPALAQMPQNGTTGINDHHMVQEFQHKLHDFLIAVEKQILLHKVLSWVKVMTLRLETKVDHMLHGVRKKAQEVEKKRVKRKKKI